MAAPKTVATYDLDGSSREFDFSFDYLSRTFVQVTLIGTERRALSLGTDFTFVGNTRIRTGEIYGPPEWTQIEIRRVTSTTERLVDFQDASILRADDLNLSDLQVLHVAEEAREAATETIGTNNFGHLDARGRRIVNVGNAVDRQDAFTYGQYQDDKTGTLAAKQAAEAARDKAREWAERTNGPVEGGLYSAKAHATAAGNYASVAGGHAGSAQAARDKAREWATSGSAVEGTLHSSKHYAEQAYSSATASSSSAAASASSASSSASSAAASQAARLVSEEYANKPVDVPVSAGGYSAMHWATKAEAWAQQAGAVPLAVQQVAAAVRSMYAGLIGVPTPYPSNNIPEGWVEMMGQSFNTAQNPLLAAKYPSGVLPDMRKRFIRGTGADRDPLTFEANANKAHSHTITVAAGGSHGHTGSASSAGAHTHTVSGTAGSAGAHTHTLTSWKFDNSGPQHRAGANFTVESNRFALGPYTSTVNSSGAHTHSVSGTADSAGAHTHTVTVSEGGAHSHTASAAAEGSTDSRPDNIAFVWCCMTDAAIPELPTIGT